MNIRHFHALKTVCPACHETLIKKDHFFLCSSCNQKYPVSDDIPIFLPDNLSAVKKIDAETYSIRAENFREEDMMKMGRPEFCDEFRKLPKESAIFLELCGGEARHALNLMKDGYHVVESDIAIGSVKKAKDRAHKQGFEKKSYFCVIDAEQLPFENETFDGIFLISSLHHLPNPLKALREIRRCLKKNGILLIGYEPNTWHYYVFYPFFKAARYLIRKKNPHAVSLADDVTFGFSRKKLQRLIRESGLELISIQPVDLTAKFYEQGIELFNRLFNFSLRKNTGIHGGLKKVDQMLFKIPGLKKLPLNWDVTAIKSD